MLSMVFVWKTGMVLEKRPPLWETAEAGTSR